MGSQFPAVYIVTVAKAAEVKSVFDLALLLRVSQLSVYTSLPMTTEEKLFQKRLRGLKKQNRKKKIRKKKKLIMK